MYGHARPQRQAVTTITAGTDAEALDVGFDEGVPIEAFIAANHARLVRLATLVSGDVASAQDIVQTACERAWKARHTFRADAPLRPWLDRIVVREAARERRSRLTWLSRVSRPHAPRDVSQPVTDLNDELAITLQERAAVRDALASLGPKHRAVVVLHLHAGYSVDEVASMLEIPRETVRSRLRTARDQLRALLSEAGR
jgi:RNA polymerase sigma-70 factor (ECF subfamily)